MMARKNSIDLLRVMSALAVIMIHTVTAPVANITGTVDVSLINLLHLIHNLMMWSVPTFFMITGYCLFRKQECTYQYCLGHVLKYVGVLFTVGLFYALLEEVFREKTFSLAILGNSIKNVVSGNLWDHMWFVYAIIGIYLVLPVLHSFMQQGEKNIFILTGLLFLFTILIPMICSWGGFSFGVELPFGGYLFYVCFGGVVAKCRLKKPQYVICGLLGVLATIYIVVNSNNNTFEYRSLFVCLMAVSIFLLVSRMEFKQSRLIAPVAACTWGIYLLHPFFINVIMKVLKVDLLTELPYIKLPVFYMVIFVVSYIAAYILRKLPLLKKLF